MKRVLLLLLLASPTWAQWANISTNALGIPYDPTVAKPLGDGYVITYQLSTNRYVAAAAAAGGMTGVNAGVGISLSGPTTNPTITNTGVTSINAGTAITLSGPTSTPTVTGPTLNAGAGISVTGPSTNPTVTNTGILAVAAGTGIGVSTVGGTTTVSNTGVTGINAGTNITITGPSTNPTITASGGGGSMTGKINGTGATTIDTVNVTGTLLGAKSSISGTTINVLLDLIKNADVDAAAALAYSKLNLTGSIVVGDVASKTGIGTKFVTDDSPSLTSPNFSFGGDALYDIMIRGGSNYTRFGKGANSTVFQTSAGGVVQYSTVTDAMIASAAGIAYSKLSLTNSVLLADIAASNKTGTGTKFVTDQTPLIDSPDIKTKLVLWDSTQTNGVTPTVVGANALQLAGPSNKITVTISAANTLDFDRGALKFDSAGPSSASVLTLNTPTFVFGSDAQYDLMMRGASNYARLGKGSNSTVLSVSSGGVVGYATVTNAMVTAGTLTDVAVASANKDGTAGTASMRTLGTGSTQSFPGNGAIDTLGAATDNTNLDASTSQHGLMQKYPGGTANFLRADGTFASPTASGNGIGFKNRFANGRYELDQRKAGGTYTFTAASGYTMDRWLATAGTGATISVTQTSFAVGQSAVTGNPSYFVSITRTTTGSVTSSIEQRIENVATFANQQCTLSFWAKAASGTPTIDIMTAQNFGSGGSPSSEVDLQILAQALTTTWTQYTITFTPASISGKTLGSTANTSYLSIVFNLPTGIAIQDTISLAEVQLEAGATATAMEVVPLGLELLRCRRYHGNSFGLGVAEAQSAGQNGTLEAQCANVATPGFGMTYQFGTSMRAAPTITLYNPSAANTSFRDNGGSDVASTAVNIGATGFSPENANTTNLVNGRNLRIHFSADAEL